MLALLLALSNEVAARRVERAEMHAEVFAPEWRLPDELWRPADVARAGDALPIGLAELLAKRFDAPADAPWMASLGDFAAEHRARGATRAALRDMLVALESARPGTHVQLGPLLAELLDDRALRKPRWTGDEERDDDGVYVGGVLARNASATPPWSTQKGSQTFHQAAVLIHADLGAIKDAVNDYAATVREHGASYESMEVATGSVVYGEVESPFAALRLKFRSDLPFPFTHYDCDLRVLDELDADGHLVTFVYSPSHDFLWFAGRDVHLPVRTSAGKWIGTLLVRVCGFDLRGVPDDDGDRTSGTRAALGQIKRRAEAAFARAGARPPAVDGVVPLPRPTTPTRRP